MGIAATLSMSSASAEHSQHGQRTSECSGGSDSTPAENVPLTSDSIQGVATFEHETDRVKPNVNVTKSVPNVISSLQFTSTEPDAIRTSGTFEGFGSSNRVLYARSDRMATLSRGSDSSRELKGLQSEWGNAKYWDNSRNKPNFRYPPPPNHSRFFSGQFSRLNI